MLPATAALAAGTRDIETPACRARLASSGPYSWSDGESEKMLQAAQHCLASLLSLGDPYAGPVAVRQEEPPLAIDPAPDLLSGAAAP